VALDRAGAPLDPHRDARLDERQVTVEFEETVTLEGGSVMAIARAEVAALDAESRTVISVAEKLAPSVANLRVIRRCGGGHAMTGAGSAIVLTADGFLLSSAHVVAGRSTSGRASSTDGREYRFTERRSAREPGRLYGVGRQRDDDANHYRPE
jgi:hypothetical protein